jgi:hypothetical protein
MGRCGESTAQTLTGSLDRHRFMDVPGQPLESDRASRAREPGWLPRPGLTCARSSAAEIVHRSCRNVATIQLQERREQLGQRY